MIDANEDQSRAANELAAEISARRALKARLAADGASAGAREGGTLSALPAAPSPVAHETAAAPSAAVVVNEEPGAGRQPAEASSFPTQLLLAAVLVAVLVCVWVVERRSMRSVKEVEDA